MWVPYYLPHRILTSAVLRRYHLGMALTCFYFAMLLTDWGMEAADPSQQFNVGYASAS